MARDERAATSIRRETNIEADVHMAMKKGQYGASVRCTCGTGVRFSSRFTDERSEFEESHLAVRAMFNSIVKVSNSKTGRAVSPAALR